MCSLPMDPLINEIMKLFTDSKLSFEFLDVFSLDKLPVDWIKRLIVLHITLRSRKRNFILHL